MTRAVRLSAAAPDIEAHRIREGISIGHAQADYWVKATDGNGRALNVAKPWLTMASSLNTGSIVATVTSHEPPSISTLMQCLKQITQVGARMNVMPGGGMAWPDGGRPRTIVVGAEWAYAGSSFRAACAAAGFNLVFRPGTNTRR
jgi:putative transposase